MRRTVFFVVCAFALSGENKSRQTSPPPPRKIEVNRHLSSLGTEFLLEQGGCRMEWTLPANEPGLIRHRGECSLAPADQAPLIGELLHSVLRNTNTGVRVLDWGRLFPDGAKDETMAVRLALAARKSPDWDVVRGKSPGRDINGFVRRLADEAGIYEELQSVFRSAGMEIRLSAVEKVLVSRASELAFYGRLKSLGVSPKDRVPFDFQAWFAITPSGGNSSGKKR